MASRKRKKRNPVAAALADPKYRPKTERKIKKERMEEEMHKEAKKTAWEEIVEHCKEGSNGTRNKKA